MTPERIAEIRQDAELEAEGLEPGYWQDTIMELLDALAALQQENARLRAALETSKIPHQSIEGDPWFSCALSDERGGSCLRCDMDPPCPCGCNCGASDHNARIDAALKEPAP